MGNSIRRSIFVRNTYLGSLLEAFLVSGITAVIVIRIYLAMTGYPQVGGRGLHIAHMLWGGVMMLVAIVLLLSFQGRSIQYGAAILGGAGFGAFIDELGKFITSDNNYFFQPTIALIYVIFILLLLSFRTLERRTRFTEQEHLAAALDILKEGVLYDLSAREKAEALHLLRAGNLKGNINARHLLDQIEQMEVDEPSKPGIGMRLSRWLNGRYRDLIRSSYFLRVAFFCFIAYALFSTLATVSVLIFDFSSFSVRIFAQVVPRFNELCLLSSSLLADGLVVIGAIQLLRRQPLHAYRWFQRGILVSILLSQVFLFYQNQLQALWNLLLNLVLLSAIHFLLRAERREQHRQTMQTQTV